MTPPPRWYLPAVPHRDPIARFRETQRRALDLGEPFDATRCCLATAGADGRVHARYVLLKEVTAEGFVFYTNLQSAKGHQLRENPRAALVFHWLTLNEQIRVEGQARLVPDAVADAYFATRPRGSQIGAWASPQSEPIASRAKLEDRVRELEARFAGQDVPRPPHWSGYEVVPDAVEFWRDRADRLHDRDLYTRSDGGWTHTLLAP